VNWDTDKEIRFIETIGESEIEFDPTRIRPRAPKKVLLSGYCQGAKNRKKWDKIKPLRILPVLYNEMKKFGVAVPEWLEQACQRLGGIENHGNSGGDKSGRQNNPIPL
jgi:hypothetical protein